MFLTYKFRPNRGCLQIQDAICEIDEALSKYTNALYNNKTYMVQLRFNKRVVKDLLYYKNILIKISLNPEFSSIPYQVIVSKVKTLI